MQNKTHQKYIPRGKIKDKWGFYDAQPAHVREWMQNHALNFWAASRDTILPSTIADFDRKYLAGLESVWGPDHPAVQDAKRRVVMQRGKVKAALQADDLEDLF